MSSLHKFHRRTGSIASLPTTKNPTLDSSVALLLKGNGTVNGQTTFTDDGYSGLSVTKNGSVQTLSSIKKYGTGCIYIPNASSYLTVPGSCISFGTGDFTIEFWGYTTSTSGETLLMAGDTTSSFMVTVNGNGAGIVSFGVKATSWDADGPAPITANVWNHIAISRASGIVTVFINGIGGTPVTKTTNFSSNIFYIGQREGIGSTVCYFDDLRITKGEALYTTNFIPPQSELPSIVRTIPASGTLLLMNGNGTNGQTTFVDTSGVSTAITVSGASVSTSVKKYGTGSIYFPNNAYITLNTGGLDNFGTGDFTIEFWGYYTSTSAQTLLMGGNGSNGIMFDMNGNGGGKMSVGVRAKSWDIISNTTIPINTWTHFAVTRSGTTARLFINGTLDKSITWTTDFGGSTYYMVGSRENATSVVNSVPCYFDDIRIVKGTALYTTNFTAPTSELTVY